MIDGTATGENSPMIPATSNILLIGLDSDTRRALSHLLKAKDFKVHWVQTGEEAMNALRQQKFGVAFLELRSPETDDLRLLTTLAKAHPMVPILLLTESRQKSEKRVSELIVQRENGLVWLAYFQNGKKRSFVVSAAMRSLTNPISTPKPPKPPTPREVAERMIRDFDRMIHDRQNTKYPKAVYGLGRETARKWLRLIDAKSVSESEVAALVATVTKGGKRWGILWRSLARQVSNWARSLGYPGVDNKAAPACLPDEPKES